MPKSLQETSSSTNAKHSRDYSCVKCNGKSFFFTATQARIVKILWEEFSNGTPYVRGDTLLQDVGSSMQSSQIEPLFYHDCVWHPAWGTLIIKGPTKGTYGLNLV